MPFTAKQFCSWKKVKNKITLCFFLKSDWYSYKDENKQSWKVWTPNEEEDAGEWNSQVKMVTAVKVCIHTNINFNQS